MQSKKPVEIRTVEDLKTFLEKESLSPEALARRAPISNMTIRRLLQKPLASLIPKKYSQLLAIAAGSEGSAGEGPQRVLVVSEDAKAREAIASRLREGGYSVEVAGHGKATVALVGASASFDSLDAEAVFAFVEGLRKPEF